MVKAVKFSVLNYVHSIDAEKLAHVKINSCILLLKMY